MRFARETRMSLDHIWCAFGINNRILATVLASPSPGRTAMLFASTPRSSEEAPLVGRVIDASCHSLRQADVSLAQALVEPADRLEQDAFIHGGLLRLAMLTYMERPVPERNAIPEVDFPNGVSLEHYRSEHRAELEDLLVDTYHQTLDCPRLAGLRDPSDVVEGHMHSGIFRPEWWVIARKDKRAIGVSLFNGSAGSSSIELVYLGLTKNARGQGIGRALLQHGLRLVSGSRERNIVLAVDEANDPALKIYEKAGFHRTIRRVALIRDLREPTDRS
ncbi:MAG: GNAT family N-acetyltransferase [Phycisphaerales bacterium]|jgi:ribosomal protein S18 acetylase RimI-like enzyme|nr:GNAT family N-acetyltransferase [Phycisphaerales bacterium]